MNNKLTIAIPYYDAPQMLAEQLRNIHAYPEAIQARLVVILVDDGSPMFPALDAVNKLNGMLTGVDFRLYRIAENIPWNIGGALNLAFKEAGDGWVLSGAIDHVIRGAAMEQLIERLDGLDPAKYYQFPRKKFSTGEIVATTGNLFLLTRTLFWSVGGYDEDFSGWYGGVGSTFHRALRKKAERVLLKDIFTVSYSGEDIPDAMVTSLKRKSWKRNPDIRIRQKLRNYNPVNHLRFSWERLI